MREEDQRRDGEDLHLARVVLLRRRGERPRRLSGEGRDVHDGPFDICSGAFFYFAVVWLVQYWSSGSYLEWSRFESLVREGCYLSLLLNIYIFFLF